MLDYICVIITLLLGAVANDFIPYENVDGLRTYVKNPQICIIQPADKTVLKEAPHDLYSTISGVKEWSKQLNNYTKTHNWNFKIQYIKQNSTISKFCDIFITYPKVSDNDVLGDTGSTLNGNRHQTTIRAFQSLMFNSNVRVVIPADGMKKIIEHEMGHALGLGHFDNININGTVEESHKSIMYYSINGIKPDPQQKMNINDVKAIANLYAGGWDKYKGPMLQYIIN